MFSWDDPKQRELCLTSLDNWHSGQGGPPSKDMTWEWDAFSYPFSSSANTRAGRPSAALGNLTLMLRTVWPKKQLNWGCPHDGPAWPGSRGDKQCIGSSMQPNTFQGENGGDGHADPTSETPLALATSVQDLFLFSDDDSDAIRVFQGFDSTVEEAAFHQLRGAFDTVANGRTFHSISPSCWRHRCGSAAGLGGAEQRGHAFRAGRARPERNRRRRGAVSAA